MTRCSMLAAGALLAIGACARPGEQRDADSNSDRTALPAPTPPGAPAPPMPGTPGGLADDRTPLEEPKGPIDPKSVEAAGQVVQLYAALLEQGKSTDAEEQWSDAAAARQFSAGLRRYPELHLQIGKPGDSEGAAGSIFVTVPVLFYGRGDGGPFSRKADVILRRVNDVDGSSAAQRRWHIARIVWSAP